MANGYLLSEDDLVVLRRLVEANRKGLSSTQSRSPERSKSTSSITETHIVKPTTAGGIPSRSGTTPGRANCNVYSISSSGVLEQIPDSIIEVYNLSDNSIAQKYLLATRNNFGHWVPVLPGGAAGGGASNSQIYVAKETFGPLVRVPASSTIPTTDDTPGSVICDIYQLDLAGTSPSNFTLYAAGQTVYNVYRTYIRSEWLVVGEMASGDWVVLAPPPFKMAKATLDVELCGGARSSLITAGQAGANNESATATLLVGSGGAWVSTGQSITVYAGESYRGLLFSGTTVDVWFDEVMSRWTYLGTGHTCFVGKAISDSAGSPELPWNAGGDDAITENVSQGSNGQLVQFTLQGVLGFTGASMTAYDVKVVRNFEVDDHIVVYCGEGNNLWYADWLGSVRKGIGTFVNGTTVSFYAPEAAGKGLIAAVDDFSGAGASTNYALLNIETGCGILFQGNAIAVDVDGIAGPGITVTRGASGQGCPKLTVDMSGDPYPTNPESPYELKTVVTDVSWDASTCTMTKTTEQIKVLR
jgi:hypothetical protein